MDRRKTAASIAARYAAEPPDFEAALRILREEGYSMGECCVALAEGFAMDLGMAQVLVLESQAWADQAPSQLRLNERIWLEAEQRGITQPDKSIIIDLSQLEDL